MSKAAATTEQLKQYKDAQVINKSGVSAGPSIVNAIDAHERITSFLRYGEPLHCIVAQSEIDSTPHVVNGATYGRIMFTRKRRAKDGTTKYQICSFAFIRDRAETLTAPGGSVSWIRTFELVRDRLRQRTHTKYRTPQQLLQHIAETITPPLPSDSLRFADDKFAELLMRDPEHEALLLLGRLQVNAKVAEEAYDKAVLAKTNAANAVRNFGLPRLGQSPSSVQQTAYDEALATQTRLKAEETAATIKELESANAKIATDQLVTEQAAKVQVHALQWTPDVLPPVLDPRKERQFDLDSRRILHGLLNVDDKGQEIAVAQEHRVGPVCVFEELGEAMRVRLPSTFIDDMMAADIKGGLITAVDAADATKRNQHATVRGFADMAEKRASQEMISSNVELVEARLREIAADSASNVFVLWMSKDCHEAAVDCMILSVLQQPSRARRQLIGAATVNDADTEPAILHTLLADMVVGWSPISFDPTDASHARFIQHSSYAAGLLFADLTTFMKNEYAGAESALKVLKSPSATKLRAMPLINGVQGWCRGLRILDFVGMLMTQKLDYRCIVQPTGNPLVFRLYWTALLGEKRAVIRETVAIEQDESKGGWEYRVDGHRRNRKVLALDKVAKAEAKIAQRMVLSGLRVDQEDLGSVSADRLNYPVLVNFTVSDNFTFSMRDWDEKCELSIGGVKATLEVPSASSPTILRATSFQSLIGQLNNEDPSIASTQKYMIPMSKELIIENFEKYKESVRKGTQAYILGLDF